MTEKRRITLFDVMALIAATAVGLWVSRFGWPINADGVFTWPVHPKTGYPSKTWMLPYAERATLFLPCVAAWQAALLAMRLRRPRPRWRRLVLQPGFLAAVVVISVLVVESILLIGTAKMDGRFGWSSWSRISEFATNGTVMLAHHAGVAVAASWLTLALIGRWRPEPSWIDRSGRILGTVWILIAPLSSILIDHGAWWSHYISP